MRYTSWLGETQPVRKTHQTLTFANPDGVTIPDKKNLAFMGTLVGRLMFQCYDFCSPVMVGRLISW